MAVVTPFTAHDFSSRMERAARQAEEAGLTGVLVAPGPDLLYLTGYMPVAITERLAMLGRHAGAPQGARAGPSPRGRRRAGDDPPCARAPRPRPRAERGNDRADRLV